MSDALSTEFAVTPVTEEEELIFRRILSIYGRFTQQDHRRHLHNPRLHVMPGHSSKRNIGISGYTMNVLDSDPLLPDIVNERLFTGVTRVRLMPARHMSAKDLNQSLFVSRANEFDECVREIKNVPKHLQLSLAHFPGYSESKKSGTKREQKSWECCLDSGAAFVGVYAAVVEHETSGYPETQFHAVVRAGCGLASKQLYTELQQNLSSSSKTMSVKQYFQDERVCWAADAAARNRLRILARVAGVFGCEVQLAADDTACVQQPGSDGGSCRHYDEKLGTMFVQQQERRFNQMHGLPDDGAQKLQKLNDINNRHIQARAHRARACLQQLEAQGESSARNSTIGATKSRLVQEIDRLAEEQLLRHHSEVPLTSSLGREFDDSDTDSDSDSDAFSSDKDTAANFHPQQADPCCHRSDDDEEDEEEEDEEEDTEESHRRSSVATRAARHHHQVYMVNKGGAHDYSVQFAAPMPDNPRVWTVYNNCTSCHNLTHGVLVCVSPFGGLRWSLGPGRGGAGGWRNPTNAFPAHTGPVLNGVQIAQAYDQAYHDHQLRRILHDTTPSNCRVSWDGHDEDDGGGGGSQFSHRTWHGAYRPMDTVFKHACNGLGQKQVWGCVTMVPVLVKIVSSSKNLLPTCLL